MYSDGEAETLVHMWKSQEPERARKMSEFLLGDIALTSQELAIYNFQHTLINYDTV